MMRKILENVVYPLGRRAGTALGAAALTYGATTDQAAAVELVVVFLSGIALDLLNSWLERRGRR